MPFSHSTPESVGSVSRLHLIQSSVFTGALAGRVWVVALALACLLGGLAPGWLQAQTITQVPYITTVAGTGMAGFTGDNGAAINAELNYPEGVAVDRAGNLYIADGANSRIRKMDTNGTITTVAGNGTGCAVSTGLCGDGGPATSAQLNNPARVAVDSAGNLYIADIYNYRIRKVGTSGTITTVAGTGAPGYNGDGILAINAELQSPQDVAVDSAGNLYIADTYNSRIRKVDTSGIITTVAGTGTPGDTGDGGSATAAEIYYPTDVALDGAGNFFITDYYESRIRKVNAGGIITTVAGTGTPGSIGDGGPAISAELNYPEGIAVDSAGNLYIADLGNSRIRKVDAGGTITTVVGSGTQGYSGDGGPATSAELNKPTDVALDSAGNFYIADQSNFRIRKVVNGPVPFFNVPVGGSDSELVRLSISSSSWSTPQLSLSDYSYVQNGSCIPWIGVSFMCEWKVTFAPTMPGPRWSSFTVIDGNSLIKYSFGLEGTGVAPAVAFTPGIISTAAGNGTPGYGGDGGAATSSSAELNGPAGVVVDSAGNFYVADSGNNRIRKVDTGGNITTVAGTGIAGFSGDTKQATAAQLDGPMGVAVDSAGNLYVADSSNNRIRKVDVNGIITTVAGNGTAGFSGDSSLATSAEVNYPTGMAVDTAGNLFIADLGNHRIRKVDTSGTIATVAGTGYGGYNTDSIEATGAELNHPQGVALDGVGNLYIADRDNFRIRKVDTNGIITTVAGVGTRGFIGDGIPATSAELKYPQGVTADSAGNLYIADGDNCRILKVDTTGTLYTVAGNGTGSYSGDGGPAPAAGINATLGVAVDNAGNLHIAAYDNSRIRKVDVSDPPSLTFPSTPVGTPSAAQDVGIENVGNEPLTIATITPPLSNFTLQGADTSCSGPQTLSPSLSCILGIEFLPSSAGPLSGNVVLTDNALNATLATQTIPLSGTGTAQQPQTLTFPNPGAQTYGAAPFVLTATASSGLPITYAVISGPATVTGSALTITGAGSVIVQATQGGNSSWLPATASITFIVNPAVLTVAANNLVVGQYSVGIPSLTYSIYGFVNGDTATSVGLSGAPSLSTSLTSTSSAGTYPIVVTVGNLAPTPPPNYTLAFLYGTLMVSANALNFMDNYFVTGDYVAAGVNLVGSPVTSGMVTGTISIAGVPAGADIVNAFLHWQTVEDLATPAAGSGFFNGYAITGSALEADLPLDSTWNVTGSPCTATGHTCVMRSYRTEVYPMLPRGTNGIYQPNGPQTVQLPAPAQGASLVVIYRVLSGGPGGPPQSQYPLKAVVIHDGAWLPTNSSQQMIQTVQGFYDGVIGSSSNVTTIYSTQAGWASNSKTVQLSNGSQYTDTEPTGAWSALVFSVPVNSSGNDGLLDAWKENGGYCDAGVNQGICNPGVDPSWVALTGATLGKQDLFVQMDYMCSGVVSIGSDGVPTCDISGGGESLLPWVVIQPAMTQDAFLSMVQQPFLKQGINVHFVVGNAVPEETCTTDNPAANLFCVWLGEPGVVGWKGGLEQIKASPRNPDSCNTTNGDCTPRFQVGKKDSFHYVLFGHSVSIPSWSIQAGTLSSIQVASGGWATVTTSATLPDANGNLFCPTRVTIDGALATPGLNGVYNVLSMSGAGSACTFTSTATTFTIQTASPNPGAYPVPTGTYPVPNGLPEPALAIYSSQTDTTSGYSDVGGGDSTVTLGKFEPTQAQLVNVQAGTLMHELGHTLGLTHGGRYYPNGGNLPQYEPNCKPNHQSVMNYLFQFDLLGTPDSTHLYGYLDYSDRALSSLDEESLIPWPGQVTPAYQNTKWFSYSQPPTLNPSSSEVPTHCDGTPVGSTESPMWVWDGVPDTTTNWGITATGSPGPQDINFDKSYSVLDGYSDWDAIDPRQVGAFATDYVDIAALLGNGGGHGQTGIGGGGHGQTGIGGGGHGQTGIGGGGHGQTGIGGGGQFSEINYPIAASYPRSPRGLTTTASGNTATISWYAASFGKVQEYIVYGVTSSGISPIACVYLVSPGNCPNGVPPVQAPNAQATSFSYTDQYWSTGETYFVTTVDIGPSGALRESTPAKQYQASLTLSASSPLTYNSSEPLGTTGGTTDGAVTYFVLSGPCSITGSQLNQLTANSGTGSCVVSATMAGNSSYDAVTSPTATVSLTPASQTALTLSGATPLTYNSSETLGTSGGSGTGAVTYQVSGPCNLSNAQPTSVQLTANSGSGSCSVTATKAGDSNYNPVTSAPLTISLQKANAKVTVTPYSVTYDGNAHTATGTATGVKGESLSGLNLTGTTHTTAGVYTTDSWTFTDGTGTYNNASGTVVDSINQASTATALSATPNPANFGQSVSLKAAVAPVAPGAGIPTGKVTFQDGSTALATVTMSNAAAAFTTSSLAPGTHNLTASYSGDANFLKSSSAALAEQVACGVLVSISPSTMHWGGTVTVTGQVISCSTTAQTVVVKFTLNGTLQPNKCSSAQSVIFTTPPFTLPAKTSKSVSFPFPIPSGTCTGTYTITATTLVSGTVVNTSTASLTITAH